MSGSFFETVSGALSEFFGVTADFVGGFWSCLPVGVQTVITSAFVILVGGAIFIKVVSLLK